MTIVVVPGGTRWSGHHGQGGPRRRQSRGLRLRQVPVPAADHPGESQSEPSTWSRDHMLTSGWLSGARPLVLPPGLHARPLLLLQKRCLLRSVLGRFLQTLIFFTNF